MVYAGALAETMSHWAQSSGRTFERIWLGRFHLFVNLTDIDWARLSQTCVRHPTSEVGSG